MSQLPNRSRQNSNNSNGTKDGAFEEAFRRRQQEQRLKILDANNRITLLKILNNFKIKPEHKYNNTWSFHLSCPFPTHKDKTPSFGYNFDDDRFNCFGCNKSGRAVEFIHYLKDIPKITIAENIISNYSKIENISIESNYIELEPKLFAFSNNINKIIQKNKDNPLIISKIECVLNWFDLFIIKRVHTGHYSVEDLDERIHKAMEVIEDYG
jgi:hypothetical protein